jgi:hypothetical protein
MNAMTVANNRPPTTVPTVIPVTCEGERLLLEAALAATADAVAVVVVVGVTEDDEVDDSEAPMDKLAVDDGVGEVLGVRDFESLVV